jgi:hypothetical protein
MKKICTVSGVEFELTQEEITRRKELGASLPALCPAERMRRRLMFRNEHTLFRRKCNGSGKTVISLYPPEFKNTVYDNEYWWSDNWDPKKFGREFDFNRPFFEQFRELWNEVPKMARIQQGESENSTFTNAVSDLKNCYLVFSTAEAEDCLYCTSCEFSRDCVDCRWVLNSELMYECTDCSKCYSCLHGQRLRHCTDTHWSSDCIGCTNCFACVGLRKKEFHILNKPCCKKEWNELLASKQKQTEVLQQLRKIYLQTPRKYAEILQSENCTGDFLLRSKNAHECWDCFDIEDCQYCDGVRNVHHCLDVSFYGCTNSSYLFNCEACGHGATEIMGSKLVWGGSHDVAHSYECFASNNLLGCCGLKKSEYCILNKQYSKEEYFELYKKIQKHMQKTGEWGEFFPPEMSPFAYNDTMAHDYLPITKEEVIQNGWRWRDEEKSALYDGPRVQIPEQIEDIQDDICEKILTCKATGKNYRIQKSELKFYRKMNLPIPKICPDERYSRRTILRNPRKLFERTCDNCNVDIQTTFAPERPEKIYCETCYQNELN